MPYIGNITQDFNVNNAMLDTDSVTSIKIVDGTIEGADIAANLDLSDSQRIRFGAGNDLQIYHDGSNSYVDDLTGTGALRLRTNQIELLNNSGDEKYFIGITNQQVELYYDNSKKFETTSAGATVTGSLTVTDDITLQDNLFMGDGDEIQMGDGADLRIYHDGLNSKIINTTGFLVIQTDQFTVNDAGNNHGVIRSYENAQVELYHNGTKKFETTSAGVSVTGTITSTGTASVADGHVQCQLDSGNGRLKLLNGSDAITVDIQGSVGNVKIVDDGKFQAGDSNDLQIYHDGSHSNIINSTGVLKVRGAAGQSITFRNGDDSANVAVFNVDDATHLYFDSSHKFSTNSTGIRVIGNCIPGSNDSGQLGTSSIRWQELNITDVIDVSDNGKIRMGDGDDLQIYHDGSNSFVQHLGTGGLYIDSLNNSADIVFRSQDNINMYTNAASQAAIDCVGNGGVLLYHQGTKKFETTSDGATVTGDLTTGQLFIGDGGPGNTDDNICVGDGKDLKIYHDGNSTLYDNGAGNFKLYSNGGAIELQKDTGENMGVFTTDGAVTLYFDNSSKLVTQSTGVRVNSSGSSHGLYVHHSNGNEVARLAHGGSGDEGVLVLKDSANTTVLLAGENGQNCHIAGPRRLHLGSSADVGASQRGIELASTTTGNPVLIATSSSHYTSGAYSHYIFYSSSGTAGTININGTSTTYNTSSDYRLKENQVSISDGIIRLKQLKPYRFNWIDDPTNTPQDGFFAHEAQAVVPEAVSGTKDEMKSFYYEEGDTIPDGKAVGDFKEYSTTEINPQQIDQSKLIPLLTAALQEEISNREALEARVAALEAA